MSVERMSSNDHTNQSTSPDGEQTNGTSPFNEPTQRKTHDASITDTATATSTIEDREAIADPNTHRAQESIGARFAEGVAGGVARLQEYENGYHWPPKYSWRETIEQGLVDFWAFYNTGFGFFFVIYALNVVAWGGMLFLLLCNAAPAMCVPSCNDIDSPRRVWIEVDSQILNALFCVTGFGLAPWRFRDLYLLLAYRFKKNTKALRQLAGVHRGWFRLEGSDQLPPNLGPNNIEETTFRYQEASVPFPLEAIPQAPPTGLRAPPTKMWKLDFVVWFNVSNTFLQCVLSGFMWGLNRYDRPSWSTGLFVCLACIAAGTAGAMMGIEGKHAKAIEGVPLTKRDFERLRRDKELGVPHWNNMKDEDPNKKNEKKGKKSSGNDDKSK